VYTYRHEYNFIGYFELAGQDIKILSKLAENKFLAEGGMESNCIEKRFYNPLVTFKIKK